MVKTFSHIRVEVLEDKVNDWISDNRDVNIRNIQFELGVEDGEMVHFAYVWYEQTYGHKYDHFD